MRITNVSESVTIRLALADAPNLQMHSSVQPYTLDPGTAEIHIADSKLYMVILRSGHGMVRSFNADDEAMPNWVRQLVVDVLSKYEVEWPMGQQRAVEYLISRPDLATGDMQFSVAIVDPGEVREFLKVKREKYVSSDFLVAREGDETVNGQRWLELNKAAKLSA